MRKSSSSTKGRVTTGLENVEKSGNLKETSESQGILLKSQGIRLKSQGICLKVREFSAEFQKSGKSQGIVLSEIHFQPS